MTRRIIGGQVEAAPHPDPRVAFVGSAPDAVAASVLAFAVQHERAVRGRGLLAFHAERKCRAPRQLNTAA